MTFQFRKESIEEDLNSNFPSQGQGNPPLYYSLSDVVVPTYSINAVTEGSTLPTEMQQAWDFSTGYQNLGGLSSATLISNVGFWKIDLNGVIEASNGIAATAISIAISDGLTSKPVYEINFASMSITDTAVLSESNEFIVFLRSGDSLTATTGGLNQAWDIWYRQIATVNGTLVNPLGFSAA